jgi:hypothetical protein
MKDWTISGNRVLLICLFKITDHPHFTSSFASSERHDFKPIADRRSFANAALGLSCTTDAKIIRAEWLDVRA